MNSLLNILNTAEKHRFMRTNCHHGYKFNLKKVFSNWKGSRLFYYLNLTEVCSMVSNFQFYPHGRNFLILYSIIFSFWKRWLPLFSSWSTWKSLVVWGTSNRWVFIFFSLFSYNLWNQSRQYYCNFHKTRIFELLKSYLTRVPWKRSNLFWNDSALSEEKAMKLKTWSHPQQFLDEIVTVLLPSFITEEMVWRRNLCSLSYLVVRSVFFYYFCLSGLRKSLRRERWNNCPMYFGFLSH